MNDTWVTLQGWVGADVECREAAGVPVASFRLGCTPRYLKNGAWVDGATSWYTVNAWRSLARNVAESVHKGEPLVVHGRMRVDVWEREGQPPSTTHVVEATFVGHDLNRGVTRFARSVPKERAEPEDTAVKELVHRRPADEPQLDHDGSPRTVGATATSEPERGTDAA